MFTITPDLPRSDLAPNDGAARDTGVPPVPTGSVHEPAGPSGMVGVLERRSLGPGSVRAAAVRAPRVAAAALRRVMSEPSLSVARAGDPIDVVMPDEPRLALIGAPHARPMPAVVEAQVGESLTWQQQQLRSLYGLPPALREQAMDDVYNGSASLPPAQRIAVLRALASKLSCLPSDELRYRGCFGLIHAAQQLPAAESASLLAAVAAEIGRLSTSAWWGGEYGRVRDLFITVQHHVLRLEDPTLRAKPLRALVAQVGVLPLVVPSTPSGRTLTHRCSSVVQLAQAANALPEPDRSRLIAALLEGLPHQLPQEAGRVRQLLTRGNVWPNRDGPLDGTVPRT